MRLPIQVSIFIVRPGSTGEHEFLLLHRVLPRISFWQPVTGGVEAGETVEKAARRELTEETGFPPDDLKPIGFSYAFPPDEFFREIYETLPNEIKVHVFVTGMPPGSEPKINPAEHDDYYWSSFDRALELLHWWDDRESLRQVAAFLKKAGR